MNDEIHPQIFIGFPLSVRCCAKYCSDRRGLSDLRVHHGSPFRQIGVLVHISSAKKVLPEITYILGTSQLNILFPPGEIWLLCPCCGKRIFMKC